MFQLEWIMDVAIRNIIIHFVYLSIVILAITGHKNVSTCYETSLSVRKMFDDNNLGFQQEDVGTILHLARTSSMLEYVYLKC
ncbi:hypothetical protein DPMN_058342 [Dreissena polymorpha]|uniref:Uncharacterized protein n=1 Tax=Dreissena polymorpha TaxID=45954 RepID=A0A9D4C1U7_DREPO|nr:hypothetical protein DPMN_058342 [Dreissena polymorpha]